MLPPCMDAAPLHGCCPLAWMLPPCMDAAPLHGCCPLAWMLPPCMDAAPLYGCCPLAWMLPPCMDAAPLYGCCPLVWMLHSRKLNTRLNRINERALRVLYSDMASSFDELLLRNDTVELTGFHQKLCHTCPLLR